jgi:hypothetical protein
MGRPRNPPADRPPAPPILRKMGDLVPITIQLGAADRQLVEQIKDELVRRTQLMAGQTTAIRWAIRELAARLKTESPIVPPPE